MEEALTVPAFRCALAALVLAAPALARADVDVTADFGHGGAWVCGAATPLDLELRNTSATAVEVDLAVSMSGLGEGESFVLRRTVSLAPHATRREGFVVPGPSTFQPDVQVDVETTPSVPLHAASRSSDRGRLSLDLVGLQRSAMGVRLDAARAIGSLLDPRGALASRWADLTVPSDRRRAVQRPARSVRVLEVHPETLRLAPHALDGLEALVVCDPDEGFCAEPAHLDALLDWVATGGRLVVALGEKAPRFAASPLAAYLPARWGPVERGDYAAIAQRLGADDATRRSPGPRVRLDATRADADTPVGDGLFVRRAFGDGTIVLVGCDLPLLVEGLPRDGDAAARVADTVLGKHAPIDWPGRDDAWTPTFEVESRVAQILRHEAFRPPPFIAVLVGLIGYVLVVGPLDWIVLRRMRKERLTTFTFAGAVVAFTVLAYGASLFLFSAEAVANRVTFLRLSDGGRDGRELVRVHDLVGYYAPTGGRRDLAYPIPGPVLGSNLPGLRSVGRVGAALPIVVGGSDPLRPRVAVEVAFRSQRVLHAQLVGTTGRSLALARADGSYEVTNTLGVPLEECWAFLPDGEALTFGPVPAGETRRPTGRTTARALPWAHEASRVDEFAELSTDAGVAVARRFLAHVVTAAMTATQPPEGYDELERAGIVCRPPRPGRALVVGVSGDSPVELPGADGAGARHVVVAKEVELP